MLQLISNKQTRTHLPEPKNAAADVDKARLSPVVEDVITDEVGSSREGGEIKIKIKIKKAI
jgi:hypothetical protein